MAYPSDSLLPCDSSGEVMSGRVSPVLLMAIIPYLTFICHAPIIDIGGGTWHTKN